jgi:ATP-dependent Clp protease ATP-binding subunit ClpB
LFDSFDFDQQEEEGVLEIPRLKEKREKLLLMLQEAERRKDFMLDVDIRYGTLQKIESIIAIYEDQIGKNLMFTESVGPEQIAKVH